MLPSVWNIGYLQALSFPLPLPVHPLPPGHFGMVCILSYSLSHEKRTVLL